MKILDTESEFYRNLYSYETTDFKSQEILSRNINRLQIDDDGNISCDKDITLSEVTKTLNSMLKNKSPGFDGLILSVILAAFRPYILWCDRKYIVRKSYQVRRKGVCSIKKIKNWQPITLPNAEYKII